MNLGLPLSTMIAFLLVLARVGGLITFLPIPGFRGAPEIIRVVLVLAITIALFPVWPSLPDEVPALGELVKWVFAEAGFGLLIGVAIAFLTEGFQVAAQVLGMQAGYGYASTIDPTTQADAALLQVLMNLMTGVLFFTTGADRALIRVLAASFEKFPAGSWFTSPATLDAVVRLGSGMFTVGLRMALPVTALLLLIDLALALLGRIQQQIQLLSLSFPVKMLTALSMLAVLSPVIARLFEGSASRTLEVLWSFVAQAPGPR
ncbi:MAG: flagellar biosynthetic protein FliR [Bryobacteraceae bacterium]|jgi:flagellar biosynthetic protein FliR